MGRASRQKHERRSNRYRQRFDAALKVAYDKTFKEPPDSLEALQTELSQNFLGELSEPEQAEFRQRWKLNVNIDEVERTITLGIEQLPALNMLSSRIIM